MLLAIKYVKKRKLREVIVAISTASVNTLNLIAPHIDNIWFAVADAYRNWYDLTTWRYHHILMNFQENLTI